MDCRADPSKEHPCELLPGGAGGGGAGMAHMPAGLILRVPRALPFHQSPACVQPCACLRVCHTALCVI